MNNKVIDLAHVRATARPLSERFGSSVLPPGNAAEQVNAILARDDYQEYIQALSAQTLFQLIKEAGWNEGHDLVAYASSEQIQTFVDLDCWQRDTFSIEKITPWLAALVANSDNAHFKKVMRDLDAEVIALFFKANLYAEPAVEGESPDHLQGNVALSPDNAYWIVYPEDEDAAALMRALVNRLYEVDYPLAWTLFEATRWELTSEMEESAFRWRTSRMEELGYVSFEEALEVYHTLNPVQFREQVEKRSVAPKIKVPRPDNVEFPTVLHSHLNDDFYFFSILKEIGDDQIIESLVFELGTLTNRTMIADGIEPGELESGHEVARRTLGYLSLGLEFLSRGDDERAVDLVQNVALRQIFQTGYSLTRKLQANVIELTKRPTLSLIEGDRFSLLNPVEEALCDALTCPHPSYAESDVKFDIFRKQAQVDAAAVRISRIAFKQLWLFGVLQQSLDKLAGLVYGGALLNDPSDVTLDSLFATAIATFLTDGTPRLRGLTTDELKKLPALLNARPWAGDLVAFFEPLVGPILVAMPANVASMATLWLAETLARLEDEFSYLTGEPSPEIFGSIVLLSHPAAGR